MQMRQCTFSLTIGASTTYQEAWVDAHWKLRKGQGVIFVGDDRRWTVERVGKDVQELREINSRWKVGGL